MFLYIGSSSVDVSVHPRTSEVGGVREHTRTSEVGGVQEHTTEKCGLVLEYRNTHEQLKNLALLVIGCWLLFVGACCSCCVCLCLIATAFF